MEIRELTDESERREAVPILRQLWSEADPADAIEWTADEEYHLFGGFIGGELIGVAGVLVKHVLHHARHAWLYDLVVDESHREEGYGTTLVQFIEEWASQKDCEYVALASPLAKEGAHEYYETQGYEVWGTLSKKNSRN